MARLLVGEGLDDLAQGGEAEVDTLALREGLPAFGADSCNRKNELNPKFVGRSVRWRCCRRKINRSGGTNDSFSLEHFWNNGTFSFSGTFVEQRMEERVW